MQLHSGAGRVDELKICCLLPSGAEILWELGLSDSVIGVSDLCDYPPEILLTKPTVSRSRVDPAVMSSEEVESALRDILERGESPYELDYDWLARELPDIIFTQDLCHICEIDAGEVNQAVRGMSVQPKVVVLQPRTLEDILDSIVEVGEVCGVPERSRLLVDSMRQRMRTVTDRLQVRNSSARRYSRWKASTPWLRAGTGSRTCFSWPAARFPSWNRAATPGAWNGTRC